MVQLQNPVFMLLIGAVSLAIFLPVVLGNKDTTYTEKEKSAILKFREEVKDIIYLDYHKDDVYLIRWLRAKNLDIPKAKEMIAKSLEWRKMNNVDSIKNEKAMLGLRKSLPTSFSTVDRELRPVFQAPFGAWNLRKLMVGGKADLVNRYLVWLFEEILEKVRDSAKARKDVSQWNFLVDMNNYNLRQHACLACVPFYINLITYYETHFPQTASNIIIFNTPRIFEAMLQLIRPLMSENTRSVFQVLGPNKEEWQPILLKLIKPEALTPQFGGTNPDSSFNY